MTHIINFHSVRRLMDQQVPGPTSVSTIPHVGLLVLRRVIHFENKHNRTFQTQRLGLNGSGRFLEHRLETDLSGAPSPAMTWCL